MPWGAFLLMGGGCNGPIITFSFSTERKQETVPQWWSCDELIFSSSKPLATKKQGPKADPRKGGGSQERDAKKAWSWRGPRTTEKRPTNGRGRRWGGEREVILKKWKNEREGAGDGGWPAPSPSTGVIIPSSLRPWLLIKLLKLTICEWPFKRAKNFYLNYDYNYLCSHAHQSART